MKYTVDIPDEMLEHGRAEGGIDALQICIEEQVDALFDLVDELIGYKEEEE